MSEHAQNISLRVGVICATLILGIVLLSPGDVETAFVIAAFVLGITCWAASYIIIYVMEQWLYESGRMKRPYWMNYSGDEHPVDEMKNLINRVVSSDQGLYVEQVDTSDPDIMNVPGVAPAFDNRLHELLGLLAFHVFRPNDKGEVMTKISRRQLEAYGIVHYRGGPDADKLMDYLTKTNLVDDIGNSTYAVTERLKVNLVAVTGVKEDDERIRANSPQVA